MINKQTVINRAFNGAAAAGYFDTIKWISENTTIYGLLPGCFSQTLFPDVLNQILEDDGGHPILKHLYQTNYLINIDQRSVLHMIKMGQVQLLEWLYTTSIIVGINEYSHVSQAMIYGHLNILDWLKRNGFDIIYHPDIIRTVVAQGHLNVLQWCHQNNVHVKYPHDVIGIALYEWQYHVAEWLYHLQINLAFINEHVRNCITYNKLAHIRWLTFMGYHFDALEYDLATIIENHTPDKMKIIAWFQSEHFSPTFIKEKFSLAKKINRSKAAADLRWLNHL